MRRWYDLIVANQDDLATLMTVECGKPLHEARLEVQGGAESVAWFADEARRVDGDVIQSPAKDKRFMVLRQPVGVVGAVTPWNFPNSMVRYVQKCKSTFVSTYPLPRANFSEFYKS